MIETSDQDGVAVLRLQNGPVNALDLDLLDELPEVLAAVADRKAVVLTGAGRCFSAGVDLKQILDGGPAYVERFIPALGRAALALFEHPKPTVAAVNGHALAGGCVLTAASDDAVMSGGTIGLTELTAGVPFPVVPLEIMRHAIGPAVSTLVLTAKALKPDAALAIGLVDEVVAPEELLSTAHRRAAKLSEIRPEVYALSKQQLQQPARARIDAGDDRQVIEMWNTQSTRDYLREFMENLGRR
jgi:enoyl-CoA hydratase/carnithine racemase